MTINEALQLGLEHHRAGRLAEAEGIYRQVLQADAKNVDALHLLGAVAGQTGNWEAAAGLLEQAIGINPNVPDIQVNLAVAYRNLGRMPESIRASDAAIALKSDWTMPYLIKGAALLDLGQMEEAAEVWRRTLELDPNSAEVHANLGVAYERMGRLEEAEASAKRAMALRPDYALAISNLGSVVAKMGRLNEAIDLQRQAVTLAPNSVNAFVNLSFVCLEMGLMEEAERAARQAIALDPNCVGGYRNLAAAAQEQGRIDVSAEAYAAAIRLLGMAVERGVASEADRETLARTRLTAATLLPAVYESGDEIEQRRARLIANVRQMREDGSRLHLESEPAPTLFMLAYQGRDDREIQVELARLMVAPQIPLPARTASSDKRIRVGFISRFFRDHTIGRLNQGLIAKLSRDEFRVTVFSVGEFKDTVGSFVRSSADEYVVLPPTLMAARALVAVKELDVLFYTDIGMDPVTYSLAHSRLAPVQVATWGHPVTSGIDTIDYFLSSKVLDLDGGQAQYTEKLERLERLAVYYYRPTLPESPKTRAAFGFDDDVHLYGCLQMLWKFHPDFDEILAGILRRDPKGRVLIIQGLSRYWDERLVERFRRTMPDVADRVVFVPRQAFSDFLSLTAACDVMLDPLHFGGGNTSYEAFAFGVPTVTLPSQMLRGRITLAQYSMMGVMDYVVDSPEKYVDVAVRLGSDRGERDAAREKILGANAILYENIDAVRELEAFFKRAVAARR